MKYPLILVHGIGAIDRIKLFNFWGRIPKTLESIGIRVFLGNTDSWGDLENNSNYLKERLDEIFEVTKAEKVNIIAHSKGGLDVRYLISKYNYNNKISSLITISTPHKGSELADLILSNKKVHSLFARKAMKTIGHLFFDKCPDPYKALVDLSTDSMRRFNEENRIDNRIYFKAYYSAMNNSFDDLLFFFSHWYLKKTIGRNDGIVTEDSAKWGERVEYIDGVKGGVSHGEIVDIKRRKISGIEIPSIYIKIVEELTTLGY